MTMLLRQEIDGLIERLSVEEKLELLTTLAESLRREMSAQWQRVLLVESADAFWHGADAETLAQAQGVQPAATLASLWADFWPDDETVDDFIATVRAWRHQDAERQE